MNKLIVILASIILAVNTTYAAHPQCGKTQLHDIMEEMKDVMGSLKKSVKADAADKVVEDAKALLVKIEDAKKYVPLSISDDQELTPEQKAQFNDYQQGMEELAVKVQALIKATNADERNSALKEIGASSKKGHKAFKMDCKK